MTVIVLKLTELDALTPCKWARWLLRSGDFVVWDTETTGLEDDAKIVSIGIVDGISGATLVDTLINPGVPIPWEATDIHKITDEMVRDAPSFPDVFPAIRRALLNRRWVIYNSEYDTARLRYECDRYGLLHPSAAPLLREWGWRTADFLYEARDVWCAMHLYAWHYGAWSDYHGNYKWQKLVNAADDLNIPNPNAHNALADALTVRALIHKLALSEDRNDISEREGYHGSMG
jgi:DNA polymerase III epsilon subunit-like protein